MLVSRKSTRHAWQYTPKSRGVNTLNPSSVMSLLVHQAIRFRDTRTTSTNQDVTTLYDIDQLIAFTATRKSANCIHSHTKVIVHPPLRHCIALHVNTSQVRNDRSISNDWWVSLAHRKLNQITRMQSSFTDNVHAGTGGNLVACTTHIPKGHPWLH